MRTLWASWRERERRGAKQRQRRREGIYISDRALRLVAELLEPRCLMTVPIAPIVAPLQDVAGPEATADLADELQFIRRQSRAAGKQHGFGQQGRIGVSGEFTNFHPRQVNGQHIADIVSALNDESSWSVHGQGSDDVVTGSRADEMREVAVSQQRQTGVVPQ